ncbi:MAG: formylglycine-rating enzyme [Mycobacterium sp.]|jgi:formylglycine-generating enzyme required for sulfatase activity|nr:formylglycine-rating enzyme [Mycobacterium sp.]
MLEYTTIADPHISLGVLIHHTDGEREYQYDATPTSTGKLVLRTPSGWAKSVDNRQHEERLDHEFRPATVKPSAADSSSPVGEVVGMSWVPSQASIVGSDSHYPEEAPAHKVQVDGFWIDDHQVTNAAFAEFVDATGYVTVAEQAVDPADFPGAPAANLQPGSMVFTRLAGPVDIRHMNLWWTWTPGASWRHPRGPRSSFTGREDHPVVHVAYADADAYAAWADRALPTESQWEVAARGGLDQAAYTWGNQPEGSRERLANYWHGKFPYLPDTGYGRTTAVGSFPANDYGLYDMAGNVWEWTSDWYGPDRAQGPCCASETYDAQQPQFKIPRRVIKGGSFLCADNYCLRYRPAARRPQMIDTGMSHIGFRCVKCA